MAGAPATRDRSGGGRSNHGAPLAQKLRTLREGLGLHQNQMAERADIRPGTYVSYERGETEIPPFEYVYRLAKAHGITMEELMDLEPLGADIVGVAKLREELQDLRALRDDIELSKPFLARAYRDLGRTLRRIGELDDEPAE